MSGNKDTIQDIYRKIEREKAMINAANQMKSATNNPAVNSRCDSNIRDAKRNIQYFEQTLRDLQNLTIGNGAMPTHTGQGKNNELGTGGEQAGYGAPGPGGYSEGGGHGQMPPRGPYPPNAPSQDRANKRPNYGKLGELKPIARHNSILTHSQT